MGNTWNNVESTEDKHWQVVYTKPRSEKKVAQQLSRMGLDAYCHVRTEMRQWSDRRKKIEVPRFAIHDPG